MIRATGETVIGHSAVDVKNLEMIRNDGVCLSSKGNVVYLLQC